MVWTRPIRVLVLLVGGETPSDWGGVITGRSSAMSKLTSQSISIIIPVCDRVLVSQLVHQLKGQSLSPDEIIIVDSSSDAGAIADLPEDCLQVQISPEDFLHGKSRNLGAAQASGNVLVFMTQDCVPTDRSFLKNLISPFASPTPPAGCYARQHAHEDASLLEKFNRAYNYPADSQRKTLSDCEEMGIKTFFFSNVAAAYRRDVFNTMGGFAEDVIVNEDMHLCARLLKAGHSVLYASAAQVYHSHESGPIDLLRRYFDIGVFFEQANGLLVDCPPTGEGMKYMKAQFSYLHEKRAWHLAFPAVFSAVAKGVGFHLGKRSGIIPRSVCRRLSGQKNFWRDESTESAIKT